MLLLIIDGNSILNRAFYGIRMLTSPDGQPTNAVYGMVNILLKHIETLRPDRCAVAFDLAAPTFRHEKFDGYKAGRRSMPPELASQFPLAKKSAELLGFSVLSMPGYEADDIIGSVAESAARGGADVRVVSGDRDLLQLIGERIHVIIASNKEDKYFDRARFCAEYGVDPEQFTDVKALAGDTSDNIPGVPGIGEKTALKLISRFGGLDELYAALPAADGIGNSAMNKLTDNRHLAYLSRELAVINREVPGLPPTLSLGCGNIDRAAAAELFTGLGLNSIMKRLSLEPPSAAPAPEQAQVLDAGMFRAVSADITALAVTDDGEIEIFDGKSVYRGAGSKMAAEILTGGSSVVICQSLKEILTQLPPDFDTDSGDFLEIIYEKIKSHKLFDVTLGAYVLDPGRSSYTPKRLAGEYLGFNPDSVTASSQAVFLLYEPLKRKITENRQDSLLFGIEIPAAVVLHGMERRGFLIDRGGIAAYSERLRVLEAEYTEKIYRHAGGEFNINSPKQLGEILFCGLGLPGLKKTKTGFSTNAEVLERLKPYHPIISDILEYRRVNKLRSTYTDGLIGVADESGRVHTTFNQTGTATGRLSSTEPNLQNIPIRTELGRELRRFFIARENYVLIDADYSQIELRLLAEMSADENMRGAYLRGEDIHAATAARVFGIPQDEVTDELRKRAKAVNFGIIYGIGDFSLAEDLGVSRQSAADYIKNYLAGYPRVDAYLKDVIEQACADGYVTTMLGRRRYIPELSSRNKNTEAFGKRVAMNSPIQGSAADIIKIAMIRTDAVLRAKGLDARIVLQIHDELVLESARECAAEAHAVLINEMENAVELSIPLVVDSFISKNWESRDAIEIIS